jgi:hypothetical protein
MVSARLGMTAVVVAAIGGCTNRAPKAVDLRFPPSFNPSTVCEAEFHSDNPKACALPKASEIARDCAVMDYIASSDFKLDDEGEEINHKPLPEYRVSNLACAFDNPENKRATCNFGLALPGETEGARKITAKLSYQKWYHNTPLTFSHGMRWAVESDCTPDEPKQQ